MSEPQTISEAVETSLARLHALHEVTNCVAAWNDEDALARADVLDRAAERDGPVGPLHGLPITVKDWIDVAGLPCTGGYEQCRDRMPEADATVVARMRAAGAIVLAKTTVFGGQRALRAGPQPTRSDPFARRLEQRLGGRGRRRRLSPGARKRLGGEHPPPGRVVRHAGPQAVGRARADDRSLPTRRRARRRAHGDRTDRCARVRTLADVLAVIAGPDDRDAGCPPVALGAVDDVEVAALRIGWSLGEERWTASAATCDAVQAAVARLATLGATIVGEVPQYLDEALDVTKRYWARCHGELPGSDAEQHLVDWDRYRVRMLRATDGVDAVVMPVTPSVAPPCTGRATDADGIFTLPASLTGAPAAVVPVAEDAGLPIAVQIVARRWRDDVALRIAEALEA